MDEKPKRLTGPSLTEFLGQRKFGCLAQTVTTAVNNGFAGYPGRGKPGLIVTLLHNPVVEGKIHSGYAMGWFFGISSNYQASAAVWGWGGSLGVKLPEELQRRLGRSQTIINGQNKNLLELLGEYRDYSQYKNDQGEWDREVLRSTLLAMSIATRYLLMQEDPELHAEQTVENLQPARMETPLTPEDFHPGESWGTYFGRKADHFGRQADFYRRQADDNARKADDNARKADDNARKADQAIKDLRKAEEGLRAMVARRRQKGDSDTEIAQDLGCTIQELLERYPAQS